MLDWQEKDVRVRMETTFPAEDIITLTVNTKKPQELDLKIRVPYWATQGAEVTINGKKQNLKSTPESYLTLSRKWEDGDTIAVRLPMNLHLRPARDKKDLITIMYGPVVLAGELGSKGMPNDVSSNQKAHSGAMDPPVPVFLVDANKDPSSWLKRVPGETLRFKTVGAGQPNDVTLIPLADLHHQRYTVYWQFLTGDAWKEKQAVQEAEQRRLKVIEKATIDLVTPGTKLEKSHNQKGESSYSGNAFGGQWRDARGGGWFSYDMKVLPDQPVFARVRYWGGDSNNRIFDILVDDRKIATQELNAPKPGQFMDVTYEIPSDLTKGKQRVTVKFQAHPGAMAGGIFGCRIMTLNLTDK